MAIWSELLRTMAGGKRKQAGRERIVRRKPRCERLESRVLLHGGEFLFSEGEGASTPMPDFELRDWNASSLTFDQVVSPRDFRVGTSAWYFGFAST